MNLWHRLVFLKVLTPHNWSKSLAVVCGCAKKMASNSNTGSLCMVSQSTQATTQEEESNEPQLQLRVVSSSSTSFTTASPSPSEDHSSSTRSSKSNDVLPILQSTSTHKPTKTSKDHHQTQSLLDLGIFGSFWLEKPRDINQESNEIKKPSPIFKPSRLNPVFSPNWENLPLFC